MRTITTTTRRRQLGRLARMAVPLAAIATVLWLKPMGLLMWARLRILTNIPRTAIAEPREAAPRFPDRAPSEQSTPCAGSSGKSAGEAKSDRERDEEPETT